MSSTDFDACLALVHGLHVRTQVVHPVEATTALVTQGTCRVTDVQMHHILLVHKEHLEILAAGCQHCFMGLEVNTIHHKSAVTQKPQLPLLVQLLQDMPAVLGKIHGWGKPKGLMSAQRKDAKRS
ncbi:hypothetical protein MC885_012739 [Smutsia gigantea]|nr:hypothetical protein MC885_012739 [Smutsia gigantea]